MRLARMEDEQALVDAEQALELVRPTLDPQNVYKVVARATPVFRETGNRRRAEALLDEILDALANEIEFGAALAELHIAAWTAVDLDRSAEFAAALARHADALWVQAALAFAEGDPARAAEICAEMGAVAEEAYARLAAARMLANEGRRPEADEQLCRALAFFRSVGATRYVREGEALMAASA